MRKLKQVTSLAAILFILAVIAEVSAHAFGWPHSRQVNHLILVLTAFTALSSYFTDMAIHHFKAEVGQLHAAIRKENLDLQRALQAEIETYGDQRAVDMALNLERRHAIDARAGETTIELQQRAAATRHGAAKVTPLIRRGG